MSLGKCDGSDGSDGGFGEAEVEKLGGGLGEHDVAGFEVAMHDAGAVGFIEGVSDFGADFESLIDRKRAPGDALGEAFAFDAFHDKEIDAVLRADIEKRADIRMIQRGDGLGFALEPELARGVAGKMCRENFNGNGPLKTRVASAIDLAHTTRA
jgi:hypothetical protein